MQIRVRRGRARRGTFILLSFALLVVSSCTILYTIDPRYGPGKPQPRPKPGVTRPARRPVAGKGSGVLPWPVPGQVVTKFGTIVDPRYGTVTKNTGIDIATKSGSSVAAVDSGKVSFADIFMGYGRMIILDHGNRVHSIYSRLSDVKVKVGDRAAKGGVIALSGDTLHFEFRVGGKSVDPLEWLIPR